MTVINKTLNFETEGNTDIIDITDKVQEALTKTKLKNGIVNISNSGSTAAITTCEYEPGLIKDLKNIFEKLIPSKVPYAHDDTWGDANAYAHLRSSIVGASLSLSFIGSRIMLGTWQQIILIDFDNRPRRRRLTLQFIGE